MNNLRRFFYKKYLTLSKMFLQKNTRFHYHIDALDFHGVRGWIYDSTRPSTSLGLKIFIDEQIIDEFYTHIEREDLNAERNIQGVHGFRCFIPLDFFDGNHHTLRIELNDENGMFLVERSFQGKMENIKYKVDRFDPYFIKGWAYSAENPYESLRIKLYLNGHKINSFDTFEQRSDLNRKHKIDGVHGFQAEISLNSLQDEMNVLMIVLVHDGKEFCIGKKIFYQNLQYIKQKIFELERENNQLSRYRQHEQEKMLGRINALKQENSNLKQELHKTESELTQVQDDKHELEQVLVSSTNGFDEIDKILDDALAK